MREKKFANVLLEDEDKEKLSRFNDIKEEDLDDDIKLSTTRELKFRELQENIDDINEEDLNKELSDDFDLTDTAERKIINRRFEKIADDVDAKLPSIAERDTNDDNLVIPKEKGTTRLVAAYSKKNEVDDEGDEEDEEVGKNVSDDDIYLTTAFKPLKKRFRVSKLIKKLVILLFALGILCALCYFVLVPIYGLYVNSQPHMIYNNSLDYIAKKINEGIDDIYSNEESLFMDAGIKMQTSEVMEELSNINNYTFGLYTGVDSISKRSEYGYYTMNQEKVGYRIIENNDKRYVNLIGSSNYLEMEDARAEKDNNEYANYVNKARNLEKDDIKYLVNKTTDILKSSIENEEITAQKDTIKVKDEEISVIRNSLKINKEVNLRIQKSIVTGIMDDAKLVDIFSSLLQINSEELKMELDKIFETNNDTIDESIINIYTKNGVQVVGIDIQSNGFRDFYWYNSDTGNFEIYINLADDSCKDGKDCAVSNRKVYSAVGSKENDNILVNIKYNDKDFGDLVIRDFSKEKIDCDYKIKVEKDEVNGTVLLNYEENNVNGNFSAKYNDNNYEFEVYLKKKNEMPIGEINGTKIPLNSESWEEEKTNYGNLIKNKDDIQYLTFWFEKVGAFLPTNFVSNTETLNTDSSM